VRQLENLAKKDYDYLRNEVVRECAARLDSKPDEVLRLQTRQEFHDFIGELNSSKIEQSGVSWKTAIGLLEMIFYLDKFPEDLEELKDLEELMKLYELGVLEGDAHLSKTQIAKVLKIRRGKVTDEIMPDEYYSRILKIDFRRRYPSYIAPFFHLHRRQEVCVQGIKWLLGLSFLRNH